MADDIVRLDVGGCQYTTTRLTLTCYQNNMLSSMFSGRMPSTRDCNGVYIIDRDGPTFCRVLNFLRQGELILPEDLSDWDLLAAEANFYQIEEMISAVASLRQERKDRAAEAEAAVKAEAEAEAEAKVKAEAETKANLAKTEFIEIYTSTLTNKHQEQHYKYHGCLKTLKQVPVLGDVFLLPFDTDELFEEAFPYGEGVGVIERDVEYGAPWSDYMSCVDRLELFGQLTQLGFKLLRTCITV